MNFFAMLGLYLLHLNVRLVDCALLTNRFWWGVLYGCIMSTIITLINEGLTNWETWKASLSETERLKNAYQRSRLLGLKGQINPHFLFNCFNTLSGLIHEDEEEAEIFLEEMTKVHRYLLRSDEELLVPLEDELKFAQSYLYLAQTRFGSGIDATIKVQPMALKKLLPPLSMHVVLENIIYTNAISKTNPLTIYVKDEAGKLQIHHTIHEKTVAESLGVDEGLDNLLNKYRLLNAPPVNISEALGNRMIVLPLLQNTKVAYEAV
jgi:LytS/YehU family sensor histidine kinase